MHSVRISDLGRRISDGGRAPSLMKEIGCRISFEWQYRRRIKGCAAESPARSGQAVGADGGAVEHLRTLVGAQA